MSLEPNPDDRPASPAGRLVVQYLQKHEDGASMTEILRHLRLEMRHKPTDLDKIVETILVNGIALGFLERQGSHHINWTARGTSSREARSCDRRRRKRRIKHKRSSRRRRRPRRPRC